MSTQMETLSRRQFLKTAGAGVAAATVAGVAAMPALASSSAPAENAVGMLIDITRCTGCNRRTEPCAGRRASSTRAGIACRLSRGGRAM